MSAPFVSLSYAEAQEQAQAEGRLLLVDATAAWCAPCRAMEATWREPRVAAWLAQHALAIQVDVDQEEALAGALGVQALPTVIAFRDGEEFDRVTGLQPASELLAWLEGAGRGETALDRMKREAGLEPTDVLARYAQAQELLAGGQHAEATEAYAWLWEHALEHEPGLAGVRGSFMAGEMGQLAAAHAPARARFAALREQAWAAFAADPEDEGALDDALALDAALGDEARTLAWYERERASLARRPRLAEVLELRLAPVLRERGRWAELGQLYRDPLASLRELLERASELAAEPFSEELQAAHARRLPGEVAALWAALRAAGRSAEAAQVAAEARRLLPGEALEQAFLETGKQAGRG